MNTLEAANSQAQDAGQSIPLIAIIGAGIGGMQAALLLAEMGRRVALIERRPWIGGSMHLLDRTFPTDSCGLCFMEPALAPAYCPTIECARHASISLFTLARVESLEGNAGNYDLHITMMPRFVDEQRCDGCGICEDVCPVEGPSIFEGTLSCRKAIYRPPARSVPGCYVIDTDRCTRCGRCVEVCPQRAINLDAAPVRRRLHPGAIIAAPGFSPFEAHLKGEYGFGVHKNVVTSLQFERLISYSGSTVGKVLRPSDGQPARRIAFISCVGSRDSVIGKDACSSICCMISAKQATIARQLDPETECTVFFIDLRALGRDYERYLEKRLKVPGIHYQRCQVSTIKERQRTRDLIITYWDDAGRRKESPFDLVVLAVGFGPSEEAAKLAHALQISCDRFGFADVGGVWETQQPAGVYAIGAFREPADIPDTIIEAQGAAALAATLVAAESTSGSSESPPAIRPGLDEEMPQIGIFFSCPDNIEPSGPWGDDIVAKTAALRDVALAVRVPTLFSSAGHEQILELSQARHINRLVITGSIRRWHPELEIHFAALLATLGLPDSALEYVSLNGQARDSEHCLAEIRLAIARLRTRPLTTREMSPSQPEPAGTVAVIGGGPAGLAAATTLSRLGLRVALIEEEGVLGGHVRELDSTRNGIHPRQYIAGQVERIQRDPRIQRYLKTDILAASRLLGRFELQLDTGPGPQRLMTDAIVIAIGARPATTRAYGFGQDRHIITQTDLEGLLQRSDEALAELRSIVMIGCAGSREETRPYCSRVCCSQAVRNALWLKSRNPDANVTILYREMRTPGREELAYQAARHAGVLFTRFELPGRPAIRSDADNSFRVRVTDPVLRRPIELKADLVVLSTGMDPATDLEWLEHLGVERNPDGFVEPSHPKMRPLNLKIPGVFACGSALGACTFTQAISQGHGAALQTAIYLRQSAQPRAVSSGIARVNERYCSGCELCLAVCPYDARSMDHERHIALVDERLCAGCGTCAMACPNSATQQRLFEMKSMLTTLSEAVF